MSMANTRLRRCAHDIARCRSLTDTSPCAAQAAVRVPGTIRADPCPVAARRCEHAVVPRQMGTGFWHQRDEARNKVLGLDKIAGSDFGQPKAGPKGGGQDARSNITCVVPSRYGVLSW